MKNRYKASGKEKLVIILVSDFDPSSESIATSFARSLRDDFNLDVHAIKTTLTFEQVNTMPDLPESLDVKEDKGHFIPWVKKYGRQQRGYELEALAPAVLQNIVRDAIDGVIDRDRFNAEVRMERDEARPLVGLRQIVSDMLKTIRDSGES